MTSKEAWETMIANKRKELHIIQTELFSMIREYQRWEQDEKRRSDPEVTQEECLGEG